MNAVLLLVAILLETFATLSLKASAGFTRKKWVIPVVAGYLGAFVLFGVVLANGMPVGMAYGIWAACGIALTAIFGRVIFNEALTWAMGGGIALIASGVFVIELGTWVAR